MSHPDELDPQPTLWDQPAPSHRDGPDTERLAAEELQDRLSELRQSVAEAFLEAGSEGLTAWECVERLGIYEYTVRPRCSELKKPEFGAHLVPTEMRRRNGRGKLEVVMVHRSYAGS
jgi:hypothetical protein